MYRKNTARRNALVFPSGEVSTLGTTQLVQLVEDKVPFSLSSEYKIMNQLSGMHVFVGELL